MPTIQKFISSVQYLQSNYAIALYQATKRFLDDFGDMIQFNPADKWEQILIFFLLLVLFVLVTGLVGKFRDISIEFRNMKIRLKK